MARNREVAELLNTISEILQLQEVPFKPRAYQRAALNVESLGEDIEKVLEEGRLAEIPGVGEAIAKKIAEYLTTGRLEYLEKLRKEVPDGLLQILSLPGVGPKTATRLYRDLKIKSVAELKKACQEHRLRELKGFGEKTEDEILKAIERASKAPGRFPVSAAIEVAEELEASMAKVPKVGQVAFAGSFRRGRDTVGDLDLLVEAAESDAAAATEAFVKFRRVRDILEKGETRSRVLLDNGLQVDLRVVPPKSFGAAMQYFTGSKDHNIALRTLALRKGLTINEYAVARKKTGRRVAGRTEEDVYKAVGLPWVAPELRENRGEIEAAQNGTLPPLVEVKHLRGDLHTHTTESDGFGSAKQMLVEAKRLGYEWFGVSDHSAGLGVARGLDGPRFRRQRKELDRLQKEFPSVRVLQGCEINIKKDGALDLDAKTRAQLDYLVGSVHSAFNLDRKTQTQRVLDALDAGIDVLGHPTGRLLGERDSIHLDLEAVAEKAKERGVALELNASPFRLDLWGDAVLACRQRGARFVIDSDAHTVEGLGAMPYGVVQARRGWLTQKDLVNAEHFPQLERLLGHAKKA